MKAARPAAAANPAKAVWRAPAALEVDVPVAAEAADEAADAATLEAWEAADEATLEADDSADAETLEACSDADEAPEALPAPKIVVEPIVVVKVELPEVSTETIADVVMAEEDSPTADEPDPPTPPTPKIVVEPIVVVKVELPEVSTEKIAEVVTADEDSPPVPDPATPPTPKMVVEPTVVVKVELSEVTTETIAEVVIAEEDSPPAPPFCVLDVLRVNDNELLTAVTVVVVDGTVVKVVSTVVEAGAGNLLILYFPKHGRCLLTGTPSSGSSSSGISYVC
jgi:hypothetical protein